MSKRKWFSIAAVTAAVAGAGAFVVAKAKKAPETASDTYENVKTSVRESPQKAAAVIDAAKERVRREGEPAAADEVATDEGDDGLAEDEAEAS